VQEALIAIPELAPAEQRRILERCRAGGVVAKTVPALSELLQGRARRVQLQAVTPEDLLSREAVTWRPDQLGREFRGRRILVTGAAGSVGRSCAGSSSRWSPRCWWRSIARRAACIFSISS
jgi:FlaA1/EpsC-like NDP-sugar epimerase